MCRASGLGLVLWLFVGCGSEEGLSPTSDIPVITTAPQDSTAAPQDSTTPADSLLAPVDSTAPTDTTTSTDSIPVISTLGGSTAPGIVFGSVQMLPSAFNAVHTGTLMGGQIDTTNAVSLLKATQAKGGRMVIKMCKGRDDFVKNADGTFSFTKWKALVDRFRKVNLAPFISDGTILGHYLIDEPHRTARWGGKIIPQATLEAMAKYSKSIWPEMTTFVRVVPSWLETAPVTYVHLDAAWLQYEAWRGDVTKVLTAEVAAAKRKGLGLAVGLNLLDGGNGTSRIPGWTRGKYAMSASELRNYGTVLLNNSYPGSYSCAYYNWMWDSAYYGRTDIKAALTDLATKARNHAKTSCRQ